MSVWNAGENILLREVWHDKIWTVRAVTIVRDNPDLIALYMPNRTPWLRPVDSAGKPMRLPIADWQLKEDRIDVTTLGLAVPGEPYSVILIWENSWRLRCWYINIEQPLRRTPLGFDFMDQTLDIVVAPDLSSWRWKDEDELEEGITRGIYTRQQAAEIREAGEHARDQLLGRAAPFDERWEEWRPDPRWTKPQLKDGWDKVEQT